MDDIPVAPAFVLVESATCELRFVLRARPGGAAPARILQQAFRGSDGLFRWRDVPLDPEGE